ncbi:MAG: hypothetical protein HC769_02305 [Cyanobacteria bacterium CRU_2_1]|nr:hypothetical protein [Cyanobacteria bacterium RU_5_0]NJR57784.1 hypothetical protein [Cyanobacteria bacterium CRU_2_1]
MKQSDGFQPLAACFNESQMLMAEPHPSAHIALTRIRTRLMLFVFSDRSRC